MAETASLARLLVFSVIAAVAVYVAAAVASDLGSVGGAMSRLGAAGWGTVLGLSLANYGLRFARWQRYLVRLGHAVPTIVSAAYYLAGFAFTTTPGKAGEAVRSVYLKHRGVGYVHSLAAFFVERLVDLVAMVLLALVAAWTFPEARGPVAVLGIAILGALSLVHSTRLQYAIRRRIDRLPWERIRRLVDHGLKLLQQASALLRWGPLFSGLALGLAAWGAEGLGFWIIVDRLHIVAPLMLAIGIYAAAVLVGALSFIPGGLGSTEAVMVLLLVLLGAETPTAVAATLVCRLVTLWFAVAIGLGIVIGLELRGHRLAYSRVVPPESKQP